MATDSDDWREMSVLYSEKIKENKHTADITTMGPLLLSKANSTRWLFEYLILETNFTCLWSILCALKTLQMKNLTIWPCLIFGWKQELSCLRTGFFWKGMIFCSALHLITNSLSLGDPDNWLLEAFLAKDWKDCQDQEIFALVRLWKLDQVSFLDSWH